MSAPADMQETVVSKTDVSFIAVGVNLLARMIDIKKMHINKDKFWHMLT